MQGLCTGASAVTTASQARQSTAQRVSATHTQRHQSITHNTHRNTAVDKSCHRTSPRSPGTRRSLLPVLLGAVLGAADLSLWRKRQPQIPHAAPSQLPAAGRAGIHAEPEANACRSADRLGRILHRPPDAAGSRPTRSVCDAFGACIRGCGCGKEGGRARRCGLRWIARHRAPPQGEL